MLVCFVEIERSSCCVLWWVKYERAVGIAAMSISGEIDQDYRVVTYLGYTCELLVVFAFILAGTFPRSEHDCKYSVMRLRRKRRIYADLADL